MHIWFCFLCFYRCFGCCFYHLWGFFSVNCCDGGASLCFCVFSLIETRWALSATVNTLISNSLISAAVIRVNFDLAADKIYCIIWNLSMLWSCYMLNFFSTLVAFFHHVDLVLAWWAAEAPGACFKKRIDCYVWHPTPHPLSEQCDLFKDNYFFLSISIFCLFVLVEQKSRKERGE